MVGTRTSCTKGFDKGWETQTVSRNHQRLFGAQARYWAEFTGRLFQYNSEPDMSRILVLIAVPLQAMRNLWYGNGYPQRAIPLDVSPVHERKGG